MSYAELIRQAAVANRDMLFLLKCYRPHSSAKLKYKHYGEGYDA